MSDLKRNGLILPGLRQMKNISRKGQLFAVISAGTIIFILWIFIIGQSWFDGEPIFVAKNIRISGNEILTPDDILNISNIENSSIFSINENDIEKRLKQHPLITNAEITKKFPDKVTIKIEEKKIACFIQTEDRFLWATSWDGYILPCAPIGYVLPRLLLCIPNEEAYPGALINDPRYYLALSLVESDLRKELYKIFFKKEAREENGLLCAVSIRSPKDTLCFGQGDYDHKWNKLANIKKFEFPYPEGRFFDLRFKDQIIVRGKTNKKG